MDADFANDAVDGIVNNLNEFNMSSIAWDNATLIVPTNTTGCLRPGAMPIPIYNFNCTLAQMRSVSAFEDNYCAPNNTNVCLPGFHCPHSNATNPPQYCPPTEECLLIRSSRGTCSPQGTYEPRVCDPGYYCPSPGKTIIECPRGYFCPQGSVQPIRCAPVSLCPARSRRQVAMLPVYVTVAIDLILVLVAVWFYFFSRRKIHKKSQKKVKKETLHMVDQEENNLHPFLTNEPIEAHELTETPEIHRLMQSFRECIGADNVGLSFTFEGLSFEPNPGKSILSGISGAMQSGSFWAVMGGSGAGKSTFLNVLMGKTKHTGGSVLVNGHHEKMKKYKKLIGYVPQDDIVLPELTVRENILHSARIRLPRNWSDARKQEHVDTLIACLGLSHVADSLVGDPRKPVISGGQRKRVSIGLELAAAPMALFLDEPTSGLDATSAASVMGLLRSISSLGVTTIAIIHQPRQEVFESIDNLLLLGNGRELYAGPTKDMPAYFNKLSFTFPHNRNPADVVMDIATGNGQQYTQDLSWRENSVQSLIDKWQTNVGEQEVDSEKDVGGKGGFQARTEIHAVASSATQQEAIRRSIKKRGASYPLQVWFCFQRAMLQQLRNLNSFFFEVGVGALAGAVIGMSAFSANGQLFRGIYQFPFTALSSAVDYQSAIQIGLLGGLAIGLAASAAGVKVFGDESKSANHCTGFALTLVICRTHLLARGSCGPQSLCILYRQGPLDIDQDDIVLSSFQRVPWSPSHSADVVRINLRCEPTIFLLHLRLLQLHQHGHQKGRWTSTGCHGKLDHRHSGRSCSAIVQGQNMAYGVALADVSWYMVHGDMVHAKCGAVEVSLYTRSGISSNRLQIPSINVGHVCSLPDRNDISTCSMRLASARQTTQAEVISSTKRTRNA
ncbi:hypothetical protein PV11_10219 [Exophiala sideris]|uniref:ABC transporter domain-containing protein n=1 Tax=Exophiala sideris TaxID=1016849 RepID=A0A0D1YCH6_9EURO|nr:hypothetical protein PV11_10219 [Exophiala sideris]